MTEETSHFDEAFRTGTRLLHQGRTQESVTYLEQAYDLQPENADVLVNLGAAYILTKKFNKAIAVLELASQDWPDHSRIRINLAAAYLGNPVLAVVEDQKRAIAAFEGALEIDPTAPSVAYNIGLIYRDMGDADMAVYWLRQALQNNPADKDAHSLLNRLESEQLREDD